MRVNNVTTGKRSVTISCNVLSRTFQAVRLSIEKKKGKIRRKRFFENREIEVVANHRDQLDRGDDRVLDAAAILCYNK